MTNFTRDIKRDLLALIPENSALEYAFSAFISTGGCRLEDDEFELVSGNERVFEYFLGICERLGVGVTLKEATRDPKTAREKLTFIMKGADARAHYLLPPVPDDGQETFSDERTIAYASWYLRCAFLGGGSCTLPHSGSKTGYHLEFLFFNSDVASDFCDLLNGLALLGRELRRGRGERIVVYLSNRESISDFLSVSGARTALKKFENVSSEREFNNNENRVNNCFIGNADRSAIASAERIVALERMRDEGILATLPDELRSTAQLRIDFPTQSLSELAQTAHLSKSCLNHRLRKLMKIYTDTRKRS